MKEVENDFVKFWFEKDILFSKFKKDTELNLDNLKQAIEMREKISGGQNQYWLFDITNLKTVTKEARDYAAKYDEDFIRANAVLVNSYITKFMFNSYLKFNKPDFPFLCYTKKEKAIEWLLEIKAKNEQR
jgi:hypothetical protein